MHEIVGSLIPLGLAVAFSPFPVIAAVLMLLSPRAKLSAVLYLLGWVVGTIVIVSVFTLVAEYLPKSQPGTANPTAAVLRIALGTALLVVALVRVGLRRQRDAPPQSPAWMASVTKATPLRSALIGLGLTTVNPKNILIGAGAGLTIGTAELSWSAIAGSISIYAAVSSITIIVPVAAYLVAATRMKAPLRSLSAWLEGNSSAIMSVLLVIFGFVLIGNGISGF